jgi:nitroreductase
MTLDQFEAVALTRRATRRFRSDPITEPVLERLLEIAHWAPSGYNLQPTHFVVVTDAGLKPALCQACLYQRQVLEAPATVVFTGDRRVVANHFEKCLALDRQAGVISPEYERKLRHYVPLAFDQGPMGLGWLWKAAILPFLGLARPVPSVPAVHKRYWLTKQVMLTAMTFMLAATSAGLATSPMEGFDESRVKRVLKIPRSHIVPVVIAVGYAAEGSLKKTRLPLADVLHHNGW